MIPKAVYDVPSDRGGKLPCYDNNQQHELVVGNISGPRSPSSYHGLS